MKPDVSHHAIASCPSNPPTELWSDPATWGGQLPSANADLVIAACKTVLLDISPPTLRSLTLNGSLIFDRKDLDLTAGWIMIPTGGALQIGTAAAPYTHTATITLNAADPSENVMSMGTRGLLVMGGALELYGQAPSPVWSKLSDHAITGTTSLNLISHTNWRAGDQIVIAPTDFFNFVYWNQALTSTFKTQVISATQTSLDIQDPLGRFRWGRLQYVTPNGMSLTPDPSFSAPVSGTPTILDERAEVGNLSRNIVIQAPDDALWQTQGFGAHVMLMDRNSVVQIDGVEFRRVGQAGRFGRYPLHWHQMSYSGTQMIGDVSGHFVRNSSIWNSQHRCIVIHGTNGVLIQNNVCFDIRGHAIFLEDAVERRNIIENNLVLQVRVPITPLLTHDTDVFQGGPSGFWLTNPDNIVRNNVAADAFGAGFWLSYPRNAFGLNASVVITPHRTPLGIFDDNVAHSNLKPGVNLDWIVINEQGDVTPNAYIPMTGGRDHGYDFTQWIRPELRRNVTYKNGDSGLWNRVAIPTYDQWVSADNIGRFFAGAGSDGRITRTLLVGVSLNNLRPFAAPNAPPPAAVATYHSTFDIANNIMVNFGYVEGAISGAFSTNDYYVRGVDKGLVRNTNNLLINSHPGYRMRTPLSENWALAGALWDANGYWGPIGNYWTYTDTFFTHDANCQAVAPAGQNGMSCPGPYYGVGGFVLNRSTARYMPMMPISATRQNNTGDVVGVWTVGDGNFAPMLGNMRHFAARIGGRYTIQFPGWSGGVPTDTAMSLINMTQPSDWFLLGVSFSGTVPADAYMTTWYNYEQAEGFVPGTYYAQFKREMTPTNSITNVLNSTGDLFWQDSANNLVWVKVMGGLPIPGEQNFLPNTDEYLYRERFLRVHQSQTANFPPTETPTITPPPPSCFLYT
ncbi:MAG: right-handed parallel beta-helix repeat-containing protein, partial [Anaerolineae bacterium]|nr:right-handed parallel beta-helix repeat-containing protein [Anaerolineae bacterium]